MKTRKGHEKTFSKKKTRIDYRIKSLGIVDKRLNKEQNEMYIRLQAQMLLFMQWIGSIPKGIEGELQYAEETAPLFEAILWREMYVPASSAAIEMIDKLRAQLSGEIQKAVADESHMHRHE